MKLDSIAPQEKLLDLTQFQNWRDIRRDKRLNSFLNVPSTEIFNLGKKFGYKYSNKFIEWFNSLDLITIRDVFDYTFFTQLNQRGKIKFYISPEEEIEGLIFYPTTGSVMNMNSEREIKDIQVLLFKEKDITDDLFNFFSYAVNKYKEVRWTTLKKSPSIPFFKEVCRDCGTLPDDSLFPIISVFTVGDSWPEKKSFFLKRENFPKFKGYNEVLSENILSCILRERSSIRKEYFEELKERDEIR